MKFSCQNEELCLIISSTSKSFSHKSSSIKYYPYKKALLVDNHRKNIVGWVIFVTELGI